MTKNRYFVCLGDGEYEFVDTAEQAAELCNEALADYRVDAAHNGWEQEVEHVCWGVVVAKAESEVTSDGDREYCDYRMVDLPEDGET